MPRADEPAHSAVRQLPQSWLVVISLYCVPCALSSCLFTPIIQPPLIAHIVGEARKHQFLGMLSALQCGVHLLDPLLGSLSDSARCGWRRRALVVYGGLAPAAGLFLTVLAAQLKDINTLVLSLCLYYSGMAYGWLPYMTVLPELVPPTQRGVAAGFMSLSAGVGGFGARRAPYQIAPCHGG
jgi:MFS family permease